jgi:alginate O-acetyltransferase complex protein AlgJ
MPRKASTIELDTGAGALSNWLLILLFFVLLLVPSVAQLLGFSSGIAGENRNLAPFPKIETMRQAKFLPRMMDDYVDDRFGLRKQLVHLNSLIRYELGVSSNKDVIVGKDGWLFYTADDLMGQHIGANIFTPEELEHWVQVMETDRDWLAKRGIAFYIVVAPDKNTIYPEKLPDYPRGAVTRIDQLAARLKRSTLEFIDPRERLFRAKAAGEMVYFAGDTHWLTRGAFVAYEMLMERISQRFPSVVPLKLDDYAISYGPPAAADLAAHLALESDLHYTVEQMTPKWRSHETAPQKTTFRPDWSWRITENQNDLGDRPRILVFGDSFTDYVLGPHMLYETFRDPVWTFTFGSSTGTLDFNLVKEVKPDVVLVQFAERYLRFVPLKPVGFDQQ